MTDKNFLSLSAEDTLKKNLAFLSLGRMWGAWWLSHKLILRTAYPPFLRFVPGFQGEVGTVCPAHLLFALWMLRKPAANREPKWNSCSDWFPNWGICSCFRFKIMLLTSMEPSVGWRGNRERNSTGNILTERKPTRQEYMLRWAEMKAQQRRNSEERIKSDTEPGET